MGQLDCFAATHQGFVKSANEDQFLLADVSRTLDVLQTSLTIDDHSRITGNSLGKVLAVADGSGPPESANRASVITIERLIEFALNRFSWQCSQTTGTQGNLQEELIEAFLHCQERIVQEANVLSNTHSREMTSSATLGIICWPVMHLAWVGNCRCYRYRSQNMTLLTDERLPASGQTDSDYPLPVTSATEGKEPAHSQDVTGGPPRSLSVETRVIELDFGDSILFCTDGLTRHLPDRRIGEIPDSPITASDCCNALINESLGAGGLDNITVIVARFLRRVQTTQAATASADAEVLLKAVDRMSLPMQSAR